MENDVISLIVLTTLFVGLTIPLVKILLSSIKDNKNLR
jgi:hypothetical protein